MADQPCTHCGEPHVSTTAFCPTTGKAMRPPQAAPQAPMASSIDPASGGPPSGHPPLGAAASAGPPPIETGLGIGGDDPARAGAGGGPAPTEKGVLDLLQSALDLYRKNAKLLITVAAVVFVPGALAHACAHAAILAPTVIVGAGIDAVTHLPLPDPSGAAVVAGVSTVLLGLLAAAVTGLFLHGIIVPLTQGALAIAAADRLAGGQAGWREIWTWLFRRLGTVLSAIVPAALLIGAGFFFLVVPGLILAFFFAFVPTVALFEGLKGTAALRRSFTLVRFDWLRMLLMMIVFGIVSAVAQFIAGLLPAGLFGTRLLRDALTLLALPIPVLGSVLLYFDVRRKHDPGGFTDAQLAREMAALRRG